MNNNLTSEQLDFLEKEVADLRGELMKIAEESSQLVKNAILINGAILSLIFAKDGLINTSPYLTKVFLWAPFVFNLLLAFRHLVLGVHIDRISKYIESVEKRILPIDLGWQTSLNNSWRKKARFGLTGQTLAYVVFWGILIVASVWAACRLYGTIPNEKSKDKALVVQCNCQCQ
ncbi:hypothetical protein BWI93_15815 [Siphonobacter sp. BAB-5385]|uniref:hypothetical protein n=1 Tax=Siphonobacter sp. BAB-5385 TaxID=1864822 RepID=UPI000B9DE9E0|nr:hypothetical protein [Siphonobacter sp. BAB-5385]OZI07233.1 hypothetical protein BWI93_15815 [Siphonobacter sp. BAB-5385]